MEYEHPQETQRATQHDTDAAAFREFVAGLQVMSTLLDQHAMNFAWCAAQIQGDRDAPTRILGMIGFAVRLRDFGFEEACRAVDENAGVRVNVAAPRSRRNIPGIVVGLVDASFDGEEKSFSGVAVVENSRGQEAFVNVRIRPNGETYLLPQDEQRDDPETRRLMRDLDPNKR